ncbi:MAG: hypothetical protein F6K24_50235 [Okeania sp. SIO2D1]|nr:hypothetical protein [Okeania sp. SIO2D1]
MATHLQLFPNPITIAECHVRLLRKAVAEVLSMESLENDTTGDALPFIQDVCKKNQCCWGRSTNYQTGW